VRFLFVIAAVFLLARITCLVQLSMFNGPDAFFLYCDHESEEDKKTEPYEKKFDKQLQYVEYAVHQNSYIFQQKNNFHPGLCMKGHCPVLDQPPEAC
jgi:hypothetical protein